MPFETDSGASISTLPKDWVEAVKGHIKPCSRKVTAYDIWRVNFLGKVVLQVSYNNLEVSEVFYVVKSNNSNLCGKDLMKKVGIYLAGIDESTKINKLNNAE